MFNMTQLREKSHIILWLLLFFFIASMTVGGLVGGANIMDMIIGGKNIRLNAGRIDGKAISHTRYQRQREIQLNRLRQQGQNIDNRAYQNAGDFAWNTIIERELKDEKIKELGLEVSLDEIYDFLVFTPPPAFQNDLMNAGLFANENAKFDTLSYQSAVENGALPPEIEPLLLNWENYLRIWLADRKLRNLYNSLGSINDEQIKYDFMKNNVNCTIDYIYISPNTIPDSLILIDDNDIQDRYNKDKDDQYTLEERITMEYVVFRVPKPLNEEDSLNIAAVEDSVMQLALDFTADAEDYTFKEAIEKYNIIKVDTIDVHESFESNSGIPFQMGVLRNAVRFAFDTQIGSLSDPITANNGIAIFHSIDQKPAGYKPIEDVKTNIRRTLLGEYKNNYAIDKIQSIKVTDDWKSTASLDSLLEYNKEETSTLGGSFTNIGKSNQLTGTLLAMENGEISDVVETFNAIVKVKMISKDTINDSLYQSEYNTIRTRLLNLETSRSYTNWLTKAKKNIEIEDYRSEVY